MCRWRPILAVVGEIGLSGELRAVSQLSRRLSEAAKLGFRRCLVPKRVRQKEDISPEIEVVGVRSVAEALEVALVK
jgi:DNA repair protein RadA/Sms